MIEIQKKQSYTEHPLKNLEFFFVKHLVQITKTIGKIWSTACVNPKFHPDSNAIKGHILRTKFLPHGSAVPLSSISIKFALVYLFIFIARNSTRTLFDSPSIQCATIQAIRFHEQQSATKIFPHYCASEKAAFPSLSFSLLSAKYDAVHSITV